MSFCKKDMSFHNKDMSFNKKDMSFHKKDMSSKMFLLHGDMSYVICLEFMTCLV